MRKIVLGVILFYACVLALCVCCSNRAHAAGIPEGCYQYQKYLTAQVHTVFGINGPVATLAAQIQQESGCRPTAVSPVGAQGLTQFMPETARDLAARYPTELGPADPLNWKWAIGAQVRYMHDLVTKKWATDCDWWAAKLSAYNGGEGWLNRDQRACAAKPRVKGMCVPWCVTDVWWNNVETNYDARRLPQYIGENRAYPRRILYVLEPSYVKASWGAGACHVQP